MIVMIQTLHKVSKTNFSKALGCSFKKVTRLLVPLYVRTDGQTDTVHVNVLIMMITHPISMHWYVPVDTTNMAL